MPQPLSERTASFTDSVIRRMTRVSLKYGAVNLSQGFPDFEPPQAILERLAQVAREGPHQYSVTWGAQNFREALARKQSRYMGRTIDPDKEIVATCGSTEAMMCAMMTAANPGDKVIVFSPFYENYGADTILSGAEPIYVPLHPPAFTFDVDELEAAFRQRPKALVLCNPSNPCGRVFTREELLTIAEMATKYDTYVILLFREGEITYPDRQNKGKRKTRSISEIVKRESIRPKHGALLFRLTNYFKSKNILQIGTTMGLSTLYLTSYATGLKCIALENVPEFATIARQAFAKEGRNPVDLRIGNYKDLLPQALNDINSLDFVFFNTLYEQHNNLWLFNECMKYAHNDTVFVFEGIKASRKMRELWEEICACPEVTVTLDLYSLGIVLFNKKLHKRDYIVYF